MKRTSQFVLHALITVDVPPTGDDPESLMAAGVRAALQAGLHARVDDLGVYRVGSNSLVDEHVSVSPTPVSRDDWEPWAVKLLAEPIVDADPNRDQPVEQYEHSGMIITVYRNAGTKNRPTYFGILSNPRSKAQTGSIVGHDCKSVAEVKRSAEPEAFVRFDRAMRRAATMAQKQARK